MIPAPQPARGPLRGGITWPLHITVDDLPPSPNRRLHWGTRRRIVQPLADSIAWQARAVAIGLPQPLGHAHVIAKLTFSRPPLRDIDNAFASLKECIDALVTAGLLAGDDPAHLTLAVVQVLGPHRGLTLEVWPIEVQP